MTVYNAYNSPCSSLPLCKINSLCRVVDEHSFFLEHDVRTALNTKRLNVFMFDERLRHMHYSLSWMKTQDSFLFVFFVALAEDSQLWAHHLC